MQISTSVGVVQYIRFSLRSTISQQHKLGHAPTARWPGCDFLARRLHVIPERAQLSLQVVAMTTSLIFLMPLTANPVGVRGASQAGAVGAPPPVINAIVDALHHRVKLRHIDMPATPRRVWQM